MQFIKLQVLPRQTQVSEEFGLLLTETAILKAVSGNTAIQSGSARAHIQDRCHQQVRSYSSLGDQILYFTTHALGCIFNLGHLLRNFFFLQRIKIIHYYLPLN